MAAAATQPPPGFFSFLKHGVLLPARNRGLFLPLIAALTAAPLLANSLAVQPHAAAGPLYADAINRADLASAAYPALFSLAIRLAIKIPTVFAVVAAFSDTTERPTVATVVGSAKGNLWGPVLTVAFGFVLELACAGGIVALAQLKVFLLEYSLLLLFINALLVLLTLVSLVDLTVVCAVANVMSVAEPGRRGADAVSRALRLMRSKNAQGALYVVATWALSAAVLPVYTLALRWWPRNAASGAAAGIAYVLLLGVVEAFSVATVTAYYFECRESKEREGRGDGRPQSTDTPSCRMVLKHKLDQIICILLLSIIWMRPVWAGKKY